MSERTNKALAAQEEDREVNYHTARQATTGIDTPLLWGRGWGKSHIANHLGRRVQQASKTMAFDFPRFKETACIYRGNCTIRGRTGL